MFLSAPFRRVTAAMRDLLHWLPVRQQIVTAARPAYAGTEGCSILLVFFYFFFYLTNLRKNGQSLFGAKYGRT